ncbi:hypothetical protein ACOME3_001971 [Neoechinorhynchus agilis]
MRSESTEERKTITQFEFNESQMSELQRSMNQVAWGAMFMEDPDEGSMLSTNISLDPSTHHTFTPGAPAPSFQLLSKEEGYRQAYNLIKIANEDITKAGLYFISTLPDSVMHLCRLADRMTPPEDQSMSPSSAGESVVSDKVDSFDYHKFLSQSKLVSNSKKDAVIEALSYCKAGHVLIHYQSNREKLAIVVKMCFVSYCKQLGIDKKFTWGIDEIRIAQETLSKKRRFRTTYSAPSKYQLFIHLFFNT